MRHRLRTRNAVMDHVLASLPRAHYFRAFNGQHPIPIGDADTLDDAVNKALIAGGLAHKGTLLVHEIDTGRQRGFLHAYTIRKSSAQYRRNPQTGLSERYEPHYPDHLFSVPVDAFEPTRPFDAFLDDPVGIDRTLVEGGK